VLTLTAELDQEDVTVGVSPERESPPPAIPPASKSPTIKDAQPMSRAERIRQGRAQYHREHQEQQGSSPSPQPPSTSTLESSRSSSLSPPHQATISEITGDQPEVLVSTPLPTIDEVVEELSDLQLLEKSTKRLQASFWRPVPDVLTSMMHGVLEGLRVVMENQEGVYYNH